jgi:hypothetical protein
MISFHKVLSQNLLLTLLELGHFWTWVTLCITQDDIYPFGISNTKRVSPWVMHQRHPGLIRVTHNVTQVTLCVQSPRVTFCVSWWFQFTPYCCTLIHLLPPFYFCAHQNYKYNKISLSASMPRHQKRNKISFTYFYCICACHTLPETTIDDLPSQK